jgi:hypothetical protein
LAFQLSARMNAVHRLELQQVRSEANTQIETSRAAAARASARIAQLVRVTAELQLELQSQKYTQAAMAAQLQTRDMTKEQMAKFVETVKGKVRQLSLFIVPDREASIFGIAVLDALRKAGVFVTWHRMQSPAALSPDVADAGVIIHECPGEAGDDRRANAVEGLFSNRRRSEDAQLSTAVTGFSKSIAHYCAQAIRVSPRFGRPYAALTAAVPSSALRCRTDAVAVPLVA